MFPLASCCKDRSPSSELVLGCLISGFFPEPVAVSWGTSTSLQSTTMTFPSTRLSGGDLYTTVSLLRATGTLTQGNFTCSVTHGTTPPSNLTFSGEGTLG